MPGSSDLKFSLQHLLKKFGEEHPVLKRLVNEREVDDYQKGSGFSMFVISDIKLLHRVMIALSKMLLRPRRSLMLFPSSSQQLLKPKGTSKADYETLFPLEEECAETAAPPPHPANRSTNS